MIRMIADSSAYLTRREAGEMGVMLSPMTYSDEGGAMYMESYVDENLAFDRLLAKTSDQMHTSQVTYAAFYNAFQALTVRGDEVLCMTMSSRLSGTYANARMAAEKAGGEIAVIDSQTTAGAFYLLIKRAHHLLASGKTLPEVEKELNAYRGKIKTFFSVDDMAALRRSGRLGNVKMSVSTILNIRPILMLENGGITSHFVTRGKHEQVNALVSVVPEEVTEVVVQHNHAQRRAEHIASELNKLGFAPSVRKVGPVLAIHLGEGAVGISYAEE